MITLTNINKTYAARGGGAPVHALADIDLSIARGEVFGIIGRSGAGKSTLLRTVNLLESPTSGSVTVDGVEMTTLSAAELRQARHSIGMIFQHFNLLSSRTVFDNVALPLELAGMARAEIGRTVEPLLDLVGLADKRNRYPAELSGGQKQRVGIARALASKPKVLLSDEATSALDPETTTQILHLLGDINRRLGLTIVLITHEIAVIKEICHKVAVMENGRVIEQGPVFDIFAHPKHPTTRSFVDPVINRGIPDSLRDRLAPQPGLGSNPVLRITFTGEKATTPVISAISRQLNLDLNIWHGQIDEIQGAPFGTLVVEALGDTAKVDAAIALVKENNLGVEVLGHALPANH
ncbi:phosphate ABC transporter ATP-binding protein (plasmid) [Azospirillum humicireducens]|uniref:Cell division ATP-binding protein FtsE n=1 Tax=Azospirillum humicireducens TaxID=1226968 RepID=A0A2R4VWF9_9PROT|nr:methionine ABC transporter ATP-binding protein [Azospirillum humicireducens]AWB08711.1 phosphate ABC transporter ATP-binding protein [Azospirillum humicireducens]